MNKLNQMKKLKNILLLFLTNFIFIVVLFFSAGSVAWLWGWIVSGIMIAAFITGIIILDPALIQERTHVKNGYKRADIFLAFIMGRLGPLAVIIISGLDFRFSWSAIFPLMLNIIGVVFLVTGNILTLWAMKENQFFSGVVRIQKERGHHIITKGPYRIVRHPGYLGSIIYIIGLPFTLASYWAIIPAIATLAATLIRIILEERILKNELKGYLRYTENVSYRLIPGIW